MANTNEKDKNIIEQASDKVQDKIEEKKEEKEIEKRKDLPLTDKWTFSTNGVAIMGRHNIPVIGFGPGAEDQAHAPNEVTFKQDLVTCAATYAVLPLEYIK